MNTLANPIRSEQPEAGSRRVRILVAITSFGTKNLTLLKHVIRCRRSMPFSVHVAVMSETPKELGDNVEVVVGLPSKDPWSLPFVHKPIFAANADRYDLFAYSEDDMEFKKEHPWGFLGLTPHLHNDEIAGFLRYEADSAGRWTFPDAHNRERACADIPLRRPPPHSEKTQDGCILVPHYPSMTTADLMSVASALRRACAR